MSEALTAPDFSTIPVGPLALIALPGCEELAAKIDAYLKTWREIRESEHKTTIAFSGYQRDSYLIKAAFPRFGSGESKCHIQQSVRGYDIFIVCDMFNYGLTYKMYGKDNMMSPDDHYANLKRAISAIGGKVPLAELDDYQGRLKSMTGGQGSYRIEFSHYSAVPAATQQQLASQHKTVNLDEE